jgi:subtilisin family serine protease
MACPHVAGGMAVFLGLNPEATATEVYTAMRDTAARDKITTNQPSNPLWTSSPNLLLQVQSFSPACDPTAPENPVNTDWYVELAHPALMLTLRRQRVIKAMVLI